MLGNGGRGGVGAERGGRGGDRQSSRGEGIRSRDRTARRRVNRARRRTRALTPPHGGKARLPRPDLPPRLDETRGAAVGRNALGAHAARQHAGPTAASRSGGQVAYFGIGRVPDTCHHALGDRVAESEQAEGGEIARRGGAVTGGEAGFPEATVCNTTGELRFSNRDGVRGQHHSSQPQGAGGKAWLRRGCCVPPPLVHPCLARAATARAGTSILSRGDGRRLRRRRQRHKPVGPRAHPDPAGRVAAVRSRQHHRLRLVGGGLDGQ
eukprot:scaffold16043_cov115-Isochrysis_galbana.AAC.6